MILDPDGWDLAQAIEHAPRATCPAELEGQVKPELFQSVLEIATTPLRRPAAAPARELDRAARAR